MPRPIRVQLESELSPAEAAGWLRGEERPFALVGEWLGGLAVLGSSPVRVASGDEDPFSVMDSVGSVDAGSVDGGSADGGSVRVGGGWVGWLGYGLGARI